MRRPARPLAALALGAVLVAGLAACGGEEATDDPLAGIDLVFDNALTVCSDMPNEPFVFTQGGVTTGFDYDLAQAMADKLDLDLDLLDVPLSDIASGAALNAGTCDVAISAIAITGERARAIDFSSPYFNVNQALVTGGDSDVQSVEAMSGKRVGVIAASTGETYVRDNAPDAEVVTVPDADRLARALARGRVEAAVLDGPAAAVLAKGLTEAKVVKEFETGEQYGMAVKKDANLPLLRRINSVLEDLVEDGTYDEIHGKYF